MSFCNFVRNDVFPNQVEVNRDLDGYRVSNGPADDLNKRRANRG